MLRHHENYNVGVIVGRFQVHELHPGHLELLDWVNSNHDTMIVVLGCSNIVSRTDPLPFAARQAMIREKYPNATIMSLYDTRCDDLWSKNLDSVIRNCVRPTESVCLYGSRDGFVKSYSGRYPTEELQSKDPFWSGTQVRQEIANKVLTSSDFRAGIIYGTHGDYPRVIPTVDAVIYTSSEKTSVFLVRKNGENKLRFPGGYVEPGSTFISAIRKEISEEVGDIEVGDITYIGDTEIDDWRYGGNRDRIHTTVFLGHKLYGSVGKFTDVDEIAEVKEVTLTNLRHGYKNSVVPEHHVIVEMFLSHIDAEDQKS
jgi:bifunctional NMN adenylyltransferase/nudix hydrolase